MNIKKKIKMFNNVFAPRRGEKVLFLIDIPHNNFKDNYKWKERRKMAHEWYEIFKEMGEKEDFYVSLNEYKATGIHNSPVSQKILNIAAKADLVLVMTEFSATSSFVTAFRNKDSKTRGASMPMIEKRMEDTALNADYILIQKYAIAIEKMLNNAIGAEVIFSTGDTLFLDLRNRIALSDKGECVKPGQFINFPSGEACKVPYEAVSDEKEEFGESKTAGILPVAYDKEIVKFIIKNNTIINVIGNSIKAQVMRDFFNENPTRANIAELGIGCNPKAVITGNVLEDEKVGLHIAYGMSYHLGGKIKSDMHQDICYSKGCPVEGITLILINKDDSRIQLIQDAMLNYDLLL